MTTIEQAEKFAAKTMTEDGLIDLFVGIGLVTTGFLWNGDNSALAAVVPIILINMWKFVRRRFSDPRVGYVTLAKDRKKTNSGRVVFALVALTLVVGVVAWVQGGAYPVMGTPYYALFTVGPSALAAAVILMGAIYYGTPRFYIYAAWVFTSGGLSILYTEGPDLAFILGGTPLAVAGLFYFSRFLVQYPKV
ncbi:MAG: hypothetical protein ACI9FD_002850 [Gammaproteobacteria bacterium]|jgi:hypothetical protein